MKNTLVLIVLLFACYSMTAQEEQHEPLLATPDNWGSEFFTLPTGFAREMTYAGYEEATFPKGWGTVDHHQFWSYVFVWSVKADKPLDIADFEHNLDLYFDGLMAGRQDPEGDPILPTTTLVLEQETKEDKTIYIGKVRVFEGFRTKKMITLHLQMEQEFCETQQKSRIIFRFSPTVFDTPIWKELMDIRLVDEDCGN